MTTTTNWENIEEILFDLHIRYCPLVEAFDSQIKQSDCNQVKEALREEIKKLLAQQRDELLDQVEKEVIGEDEPRPIDSLTIHVDVRNFLRQQLRQKLSALRKEGGGK